MAQDTNTMGWPEYLVAHLYWGWLAYLFFSSRLFLRICSPWTGALLPTDTSRQILLILVLWFGVLGAILSVAGRRNYRNLFLNITAPYGVYLVFETLPRVPVYVWAALIGWAVFVLFYAAALFSAPVRRRRNLSGVICRRLGQLFWNTRAALHGLLGLYATVMSVLSLLGFSDITAEHPLYPVKETLYPPSAFAEELEDLREDHWFSLSLQEKVDLMQLVANIETSYLGIPEGLQVCCESLPPYTLGSYVHEDSTIRIGKDHLLYDSAEACVETVLHEAYHSFQHYLCAVYSQVEDPYRELYFLRNAAIYADEFGAYQDGSSGFWAYYNQSCEADARRYAEDRLVLYLGVLAGTEDGPSS